MKNFKYAFTMIELVFVIVILGILASVAIPKLSGVTKSANLAQGMATVSSIRAAIASERQRNLIKGDASYPAILDDAVLTAGESANGADLFDGNSTIAILQYPVYSGSSDGDWMKITPTAVGVTASYKFYVTASETEIFNYTVADGRFDCVHTNALCKELAE